MVVKDGLLKNYSIPNDLNFIDNFPSFISAHLVPATRTATAGNVHENRALQSLNCVCQSLV